MKAYIELVKDVLANGTMVDNRTATAAKFMFGRLFEFDMRSGFPLLTTKKMFPKLIFVELEGFIKGITDKRWYQARKCFIWDEWCNPQSLRKYNWDDLEETISQLIQNNMKSLSGSPKTETAIDYLMTRAAEIKMAGASLESIRDLIEKTVQMYEPDLGPIYGYQWRNFGGNYSDLGDESGVDQFKYIIDTLKTRPTDRRMLALAWNPLEMKNNTVALPACHYAFQVNSDGKSFDLMWNQRSVDIGAGLPFNIASYAMLMLLIAKETGLTPGMLKGCLGNCHIYENHIEQLKLQVTRDYLGLPTMTIPDSEVPFSIYDWTCDQYEISNYSSHGVIKLPIAV